MPFAVWDQVHMQTRAKVMRRRVCAGLGHVQGPHRSRAPVQHTLVLAANAGLCRGVPAHVLARPVLAGKRVCACTFCAGGWRGSTPWAQQS